MSRARAQIDPPRDPGAAIAERGQPGEPSREVQHAELDVPFDDRLLAIAERVRQLDRSMNRLMSSAVGRARQIDDQLIEEMPHGRVGIS